MISANLTFYNQYEKQWLHSIKKNKYGPFPQMKGTESYKTYNHLVNDVRDNGLCHSQPGGRTGGSKND